MPEDVSEGVPSKDVTHCGLKPCVPEASCCAPQERLLARPLLPSLSRQVVVSDCDGGQPSPSRWRWRQPSIVGLAPGDSSVQPWGRVGFRTRLRSISSDRLDGAAGCYEPSVWWLAPMNFLSWYVQIGPQAYMQSIVGRYYGLDAATVWTVMLSARGVLSLLCSPLLGAMSDRYGRKPFLFFKGLVMLPYLLVVAFLPDIRLRGTLLVGFMVLAGLGGNPFGCSFAYCADCSLRNSRRSLNETIALCLAISFTPAFIVSPQICIWISTNWGESIMLKVLVAACILMMVLVLVMPESLDKRRLAAFPASTPTASASAAASPGRRAPELGQCKSLNPFRYFRLLSGGGPAGPEIAAILRRVCGIMLCLYFAKWSIIGVSMLFAELHFGWSPERTSNLLTAWGISQFSCMHMLAAIERRYPISRGRETITSWAGLITGLAGMVLLSAAVVDVLLLPAMFVGAASMVTYTALTSYSSKLVDPSMLGEVQGLLGTTLDITEVVGPLFFGVVMRACAKTALPTLPFFFGILFVLFAMALQWGLPSLEQATSRMEQSTPRMVLPDPVAAATHDEPTERDSEPSAVAPAVDSRSLA